MVTMQVIGQLSRSQQIWDWKGSFEAEVTRKSENPRLTRLAHHIRIGDTTGGIRPPIPPACPPTPKLPKPLCNPHQSNINGIAMNNVEGLDVLSEN